MKRGGAEARASTEGPRTHRERPRRRVPWARVRLSLLRVQGHPVDMSAFPVPDGGHTPLAPLVFATLAEHPPGTELVQVLRAFPRAPQSRTSPASMAGRRREGLTTFWGRIDPGIAPRTRRKSRIRTVRMEVSVRQVHRAHPGRPMPVPGPAGEVSLRGGAEECGAMSDHRPEAGGPSLGDDRQVGPQPRDHGQADQDQHRASDHHDRSRVPPEPRERGERTPVER